MDEDEMEVARDTDDKPSSSSQVEKGVVITPRSASDVEARANITRHSRVNFLMHFISLSNVFDCSRVSFLKSIITLHESGMYMYVDSSSRQL